MQINKMMLCASVVVLVSAVSMTGQAADKQKDKKTDVDNTKVVAKVPMVIEAEKLTFSDLTGDVFAQGSVSIVQNTDKILTEFMRGNTKKTEVWMDGKADLFQPGVKMTGIGTHYNYTEHVGSMHEASGLVGRQIITGKDIDILPAEMILHDGTMTSCPAKIPDYHVSADRVEIWPGEKMIAYNAKFWIKDKMIFAMPKYQRSLKDNAQSEFPRIGYNNSDGFSIRQYLEYPIGDNVAAYTDLGYYSKIGFKPVYGLVDREKNYSLNLVDGYYRDSDGYWIKKEPELRFDFYSHRIGQSPVSYTFYALYGKWTDTTKTSWHQDYNLYFSHDTIKLNNSLFLNLGTGLERVHESYDNSTRDILKLDTVLTKVWTPRFTTAVEYHYTKNNTALFNYDAADLAREGDIGFTYKIDKMNTIGFRQSYNMNNGQIYDQDYTWYRNLHCWQATITYRAKRHQLTWDMTTTRW